VTFVIDKTCILAPPQGGLQRKITRLRKLAQGEAKTAAPAFLPISLTAPAKSVDTSCDPSASEAPATDSRIEIELANGRRVRVGPGADMNALKRILDIADGRQRP